MQYRLAVAQSEYRDLASEFVLRSAPGCPAFPVRLAEDLFLRCTAHAAAPGPLTLWDPCCGSGYLATVIGLFNRAGLDRILCSDVSPDAVTLASRNLALLTAAGLADRECELLGLAAEFGKQDYAERAAAARRPPRSSRRPAAICRAAPCGPTSSTRLRWPHCPPQTSSSPMFPTRTRPNGKGRPPLRGTRCGPFWGRRARCFPGMR
jgi:hypothetical protein